MGDVGTLCMVIAQQALLAMVIWVKNLIPDIYYLVGEILLDSMLQIPKGFLGRSFRGKTFTKRLPHVKYDADTFRLCLPYNWCNDFCGFLIRVVTLFGHLKIDVIMKQEPDDEDFGFEIWQDSNESPEPDYGGGWLFVFSNDVSGFAPFLAGGIEDGEMKRNFNMGTGMVLVFSKEVSERVVKEGEMVYRIGEVFSVH
uniref:Uncharacterized protein n=1 Tax=Lactuca sativa TaxID=4236 RepID=A0A9R1W023_LACSA|nr:hypothetical protein LSAT_V11C300134530 [Lactuca sativa]